MLVLIFAAVAFVSVESQVICRQPTGNFSDPTSQDCRTYIQCDSAEPSRQQCPNGTIFDDRIGGCDDSENATCRSSIIPTRRAPGGVTGPNRQASDQANLIIIPGFVGNISQVQCAQIQGALNRVYVSVVRSILRLPCRNNECNFPPVTVRCASLQFNVTGPPITEPLSTPTTLPTTAAADDDGN